MSRGRRSNADVDTPWLLITAVYVLSLAAAASAYLILHYFWGYDMPVTFHQLLGHGLVYSGLVRVWFIFAWAAGVTLIDAMLGGRSPDSEGSRTYQIARGIWTSLNAGFFEEIIYRGLVFLSALVVARFFNVITLGIFSWLYVHWFIAIANFATLHKLQPELLYKSTWLVGAAIIMASVKFRDGHEHLGFIGWVNSWFIGMVMFYLVFNYGLATAIAAHVIYDAIIFTLRGITSDHFSRRVPIRRPRRSQ